MAYQTDKGELIIEEGDQCLSCAHRAKCPIIGSLSEGVFYINPDLEVYINDCYFYSPRTLRLVQ